MVLTIIAALGIWSILAVIGIRRGLRGELVIFRSWFDVVLTGILILCSGLGTSAFTRSSDPSVYIPALVVAIPWLCLAKMANRHWLALGLSIPAKLTLVLLTLLFALLALSSAVTALSRKSDARTRLTNAAVAGCAVAVTVYLCSMIRRFVFCTPAASHCEHRSSSRFATSILMSLRGIRESIAGTLR